MSRVLAVLLLAVTTPGLSRDRIDPLSGYVAGSPRDCLEDSRTAGPDIVDNRTIVYRQSRQQIWRNDLPDACPGLRQGVTLIVLDRMSAKLCAGDRFRTIEPPSRIPGPLCRLGRFTSYHKPGPTTR